MLLLLTHCACHLLLPASVSAPAHKPRSRCSAAGGAFSRRRGPVEREGLSCRELFESPHHRPRSPFIRANRGTHLDACCRETSSRRRGNCWFCEKRRDGERDNDDDDDDSSGATTDADAAGKTGVRAVVSSSEPLQPVGTEEWRSL